MNAIARAQRCNLGDKAWQSAAALADENNESD
jgi:hypothetical protein